MGTIDSDAHVIETMTTFDYIEPEYRHLKPRVVRQVEGEHVKSNEGGAQKEFWIIDGRLQPKEHNVGSNTSDVSREMRDVRARLDHMDALKIDVQVLYPTVFLRAWTQDPTVEVVLCRSYNRWLADIWKEGKGRLRWAVMPPLRDMEETRKELKFGKENGACGIFVRGLEAEMRLVNPVLLPAVRDGAGIRPAGLFPLRQQFVPGARHLRGRRRLQPFEAAGDRRVPQSDHGRDTEKVPESALGLHRGERAMDPASSITTWSCASSAGTACSRPIR